MNNFWLNAIAHEDDLATKGEIILTANDWMDLEQEGVDCMPISIVPQPQFEDDEPKEEAVSLGDYLDWCEDSELS